MKQEIKKPMISIQEAAEMLGCKPPMLYDRIAIRRAKGDIVYTHENGKSFFIAKLTGRVALLPIGEPPPDIEAIENAAAAAILDQLLPWLCAHCHQSVLHIKQRYEGSDEAV